MPAIAVTDHGVMFGIKSSSTRYPKNGKPLGAIKDYEKELKELKSKTELTAEEQARLEEIPAKIEEEKKKYSNRSSVASAIVPVTDGIASLLHRTTEADGT